jgi:hypothetical protein
MYGYPFIKKMYGYPFDVAFFSYRFKKKNVFDGQIQNIVGLIY